jgi:hypothetical protein
MLRWSKIFFFSASTMLALLYSPSNLALQVYTSFFFCWTNRIKLSFSSTKWEFWANNTSIFSSS